MQTNADAKACFQGQTHGHKGFLLSPDKAVPLCDEDERNQEVIFPFLTVNDMLSTFPPNPKRYVIDFHPRDLVESSKYKAPFAIVKKAVLPDRLKAAEKEEVRNNKVLKQNPEAKVNLHHANFLKQWWLLSWARGEMVEKIKILSRYIVCGQVTKRPIFEFVSPSIRPNAACMIFPFEDDYSFGVLQSAIHWDWFIERCSTLTERFRYTSDTVFDTFPWPQSPAFSDVIGVAEASRALREVRRNLMVQANLSFRKLYRLIELPGENPLKSAQHELDSAVRSAYQMSPTQDILSFLLDLNKKLAAHEESGSSVQAPGIPLGFHNPEKLMSKDRMTMLDLKPHAV